MFLFFFLLTILSHVNLHSKSVHEMDLELVKRSLDYAIRKRKWVLVLGAFGFTGYGLHRIYTSPPAVKKRQRLMKLFGAIVSVAEMVSDSSEAIGVVAKDLKEFIASDSDQIPQSLKQISKITNSDEFSESLTVFSMALTVGILRGRHKESFRKSHDSGGYSCFSNRVMDKLFSDAGSCFASAVVGSFTRNLVTAYYLGRDHLDSESSQNKPSWIEVVCEDKYRDLIRELMQVFVSTAVTTYVDKTLDINIYDQIFSGLTNPKHEDRIRFLLVSTLNAAVETFIRTTNSTHPKVGLRESFSGDEKARIGATLISRVNQRKDKDGDRGWVGNMCSALAIPRNRRFVRDVTGTMTFETVRSFLEFLLEKLSECMKRSFDVVKREVVDRGIEGIRFLSGRSCAVATVCISLCLHILNGPWVFVPF